MHAVGFTVPLLSRQGVPLALPCGVAEFSQQSRIEIGHRALVRFAERIDDADAMAESEPSFPDGLRFIPQQRIGTHTSPIIVYRLSSLHTLVCRCLAPPCPVVPRHTLPTPQSRLIAGDAPLTTLCHQHELPACHSPGRDCPSTAAGRRPPAGHVPGRAKGGPRVTSLVGWSV